MEVTQVLGSVYLACLGESWRLVVRVVGRCRLKEAKQVWPQVGRSILELQEWLMVYEVAIGIPVWSTWASWMHFLCHFI